jgi:signal peptide peptidase SppA
MFGLIQEIFNGYWHINKAYAETAKPLIINMIEGKLKQDDFSKARQQLRPDYYSLHNGIYQLDQESEEEKKLFKPESAPPDSIGLIKIYGAITYNDQFCGPAGAETISNYLEGMSNNENINAVILQIRSEGGEVYASERLVEAIHAIEKPVIGFVQNYAFSAANRILAACDWCVANSDMAMLGSLGTYTSVADDEEYWNQLGIKWIDIYADKSKDKNKDYLEAIKGNTALIKAKVNSFNEAFLQGIAQDRAEKLTAAESTWGTGKTWFAKEAMSLGLIDEIASLPDVIKSLQNTF